MKISLLSNISSFSLLSSDYNINHEPAQKYYRTIEEILKLLNPVLDAVFDANVASLQQLQKPFKELSCSVDDLRDLFENWHPLRSKIYFALGVETYITKVRASGIEILELLKSSEQGLPIELDASEIELYVQKIEHIGLEQTSVIVNEAIREQEDGSGPSSETLAKFANCLSLRSNQEILIEAVALEKLKDHAEQAENNSEAEYYDQLIALVTHMQEQLVTLKQSESCNSIPIPADFCCPLSLELMTDPVIVASGQTYERVFIRTWIDLGLTVCPKTRQTLSHTNLIPNYTVKALIANWCEVNNVKLPDPVNSKSSNLPSYLSQADNILVSPVSTGSNGSTIKNSASSSRAQQREPSPSHPRSSSEGSLADIAGNGNLAVIRNLSVRSSEELALDSDGQSPKSLFRTTRLPLRNVRTSLLSSAHNPRDMLADSNVVPSQATAHSSDTSGEQTSEPQASLYSTTPRRETGFPARLQTRSRNQTMFRRPVARVVSSPATQDLSEVETKVRNLVENLQSVSLNEQRIATAELRQLAKHNMDDRITIASCGAIYFLVKLLRSTDMEIQENAVTALLNLSINDTNKAIIADVGAIEPLIHVLESGSPEAKENSAATLFSLSLNVENKVRIGRSGAIRALVDLLGNGTPRGKKDASTALYNLSILHENKAQIVQEGAVRYLVGLMDPAAGLVDKAVAVLANLATIHEGRTAIGQEGVIPILVAVVELGSTRSKENAAAALLQLCTSSNRYCSLVIREGAVPPLVALSQSGTPRAKEKAHALLSHFRNQRRANAGRS